MFSVIFEVHPRADQWEAYLGEARMLKPELEAMDGFVDNVRYASLTRPGWILSLSGWRDEKALVRWRTQIRHHAAQEKGRDGILLDYHLRVGQLTQDTHIPQGQVLREQRLDETQVGAGTTVTLVNARRPADWAKSTPPEEIAAWLGLRPAAEEVVVWDVFDAVLTPGDVIALITWRTSGQASAFSASLAPGSDRRLRQVRVVRDYGMFDRREAPQYYPEVRNAG